MEDPITPKESEEFNILKRNMTTKLDQNEETVMVLNGLISKLRKEIDEKISEITSMKDLISNKDKLAADLQNTINSNKRQSEKEKAALYTQTRDAQAKKAGPCQKMVE